MANIERNSHFSALQGLSCATSRGCPGTGGIVSILNGNVVDGVAGVVGGGLGVGGTKVDGVLGTIGVIGCDGTGVKAGGVIGVMLGAGGEGTAVGPGVGWL